jgi:catechol 2,3-dioxygenase-like lactoylglutathione lyase family enzyme
MAHPIIEHVNLTVSDPERSAHMVEALFGWKERWRGPAGDGGFTIHVGSETAYLAFYTGPGGFHADARYPKGEPLNHVGIQVDDLDAVEDRVVALGLVPFSHGDYEPGRRFYFFDHDSIEFEIVSYLGVQAGT